MTRIQCERKNQWDRQQDPVCVYVYKPGTAVILETQPARGMSSANDVATRLLRIYPTTTKGSIIIVSRDLGIMCAVAAF